MALLPPLAAACTAAAAVAVRAAEGARPVRESWIALCTALVAAKAICCTPTPERAATPLLWARRCAATACAAGMLAFEVAAGICRSLAHWPH